MKLDERLTEVHQALDDVFWAHQEALLRMDFETASRLLHQYRQELESHMREEEADLFLRVPEEGAPPGGQRVQLLAEHDKMRRMLVGIEASMNGLLSGGGAPRGVLQLLESEFRFKHLSDHHQRREMQVVVPWLQATLGDAACRQLAEALHRIESS